MPLQCWAQLGSRASHGIIEGRQQAPFASSVGSSELEELNQVKLTALRSTGARQRLARLLLTAAAFSAVSGESAVGQPRLQELAGYFGGDVAPDLDSPGDGSGASLSRAADSASPGAVAGGGAASPEAAAQAAAALNEVRGACVRSASLAAARVQAAGRRLRAQSEANNWLVNGLLQEMLDFFGAQWAHQAAQAAGGGSGAAAGQQAPAQQPSGTAQQLEQSVSSSSSSSWSGGAAEAARLTHVDSAGRAAMVDVSEVR